MDSKRYFEEIFCELKIKKILESEIYRDPKIVIYEGNQVDLIYFNPEKIICRTRFINYLKYMKDTNNEYTIKNIIGYTILSNMHYFVLEKIIEEIPLADYVKNLTLIKKIKTIINLIEIIYYFHNTLRITIKVLSTNNVYVRDNNLKLNVSNLKRVIQECSFDKFKKESLYYEYLPPDLFDIDNSDVDGEIEYKNEGNIWSLGCIISEVFSGFIPWYNRYNKNEIIIIKLLVKKTPFPIPNKINELNYSIYKLIEECTNTNPNRRPTIEFVLKSLNDIVKNKEKVYSIIMSTQTNKRIKQLNRKYLISSIYEYL